MRRPRALLLTSAAVAACLAAGATAVAVAQRPAAASDAGARRVSAAIRAERLHEVEDVPDQVVTGPLPNAGETTASAASERPGVITFAYAGDSITARPDSWLHVMTADPSYAGLEAVGGYAHSGYRSDQVLARIGRVDADVLVVELGTNDVNQAKPFARIVRNVDAVAAKVGARHVLLVAAPPDDHTSSLWGADRRAGAARLNRLLAADAARRGWRFDDPFAAIREADDGYRPGTSTDGIHPTGAADVGVARAVAAGIRAADRLASP